MIDIKVGDYVKLWDYVFYVNKDLSKSDLDFLEFEVILVYINDPDDAFFVGKVCNIIYDNENLPEIVTPIFVKNEK